MFGVFRVFQKAFEFDFNKVKIFERMMWMNLDNNL